MWEPIPEEVRLGAGEVHLFLARTDGGDVGRWEKFLTEEEKERGGRLKIAAKRVEFVVSRGVLRWLLGKCLGCEAGAVGFLTGNHGKPLLDGGGLFFNLSHTAGRVLIAISKDREVGVDVEWMREKMECEPLAKRFFTGGEFAELGGFAEGEKVAAFFRCWTRKEAVLKASGKGIAGGLDSFQVPLGVGGLPMRVAGWELHDVPMEAGYAGYAGAVAVEGEGAALKFWSVGD